MTATPSLPWPALTKAQAHARLTAPGARFEMEERVIRGVPQRVWKNGPKTLRDLFNLSQTYGAREFLVYEGDRATYDAFGAAVLTLAAELVRQGVTKGDRVALAMRNLPEWPVAHFASLLTGAIVAPLNAWWSGPELAFALKDCGARIAIVDAERMERLLPHLDELQGLEHVYVVRHHDPALHPKVERLQCVIGAVDQWGDLPRPAAPDVAIDPEDPATLFYTSGTTGQPKGALATHRAGANSVLAHGVAHFRAQLMAGLTPPEGLRALPQKTHLLVVPLFHVTGCFAYMGPMIAAGARVVMMRKWDPEEAMKLIAAERVNATGGVPTIPWHLVEHPARGDYDLSSLEAITYGGAPSAPDLVRRIQECFAVHPGNGWGMTETSATFASHVGREYVQRPLSCGAPAPVGEVRIMSVDGDFILPTGEVGEMWVKGPQVAIGYWNRPEETARTFRDGWLRTGDLARLDEEGYCYIVDRAKDIVIRAGENIYCTEVENILYAHPDVIDAAVVGIPHLTLGEEPAAVVTLRPGSHADSGALRAFAAERLASFKVPTRVLVLGEPLPRNANGKILKTELKSLFAAETADA